MSTPDLDAIQARAQDAVNYPGMVTIEQSQADVPALLAYARDLEARIDAALAIIDTKALDRVLIVNADKLRAALTATDTP